MEKMTYEEYRSEVIKEFHKTTDGHYPKEEIEQYIVECEERIKKSYQTKTELIKDGMRQYYDPSGLAYAMDFEF